MACLEATLNAAFNDWGLPLCARSLHEHWFTGQCQVKPDSSWGLSFGAHMLYGVGMSKLPHTEPSTAPVQLAALPPKLPPNYPELGGNRHHKKMAPTY
jgi:hypothetical protein